jgi:hypothetical protein
LKHRDREESVDPFIAARVQDGEKEKEKETKETKLVS